MDTAMQEFGWYVAALVLLFWGWCVINAVRAAIKILKQRRGK